MIGWDDEHLWDGSKPPISESKQEIGHKTKPTCHTPQYSPSLGFIMQVHGEIWQLLLPLVIVCWIFLNLLRWFSHRWRFPSHVSITEGKSSGRTWRQDDFQAQCAATWTILELQFLDVSDQFCCTRMLLRCSRCSFGCFRSPIRFTRQSLGVSDVKSHFRVERAWSSGRDLKTYPD